MDRNTLGAQIKQAIGAHGMWKTRLVGAIETGKSDIPAATARLDDHCPFGKWLLGTLPLEVMRSPKFRVVKELHAKFHVVAADTLAMALAGRRVEAERALGADGAFTQASAALTREMMAWMQEK
jgi:chemoreceptor zinc-binding protein